MHGGLWEFPGGKIESGEEPAAAIQREIEEELSLRLARESLVVVGFASDVLSIPASPTSLTMLLYSCRDWAGTPKPLAAEAIGWFEASALESLAMPPVDRPLAARLRELLENNLL